jgi:uncharacterized membrane protein
VGQDSQNKNRTSTVLEHLWQLIIRNPADLAGAILFLLVFPIYHGLYPVLLPHFGNRATKVHIDPLRRSWIIGILERQDIVLAVQQTRNLSMVNSLLASSSLILMGLCANLLIRGPGDLTGASSPFTWIANTQAVPAKVFLLMLVFAVSFGYCMASLRHLGHFTLVIGADPESIALHQGDPIEYLSGLINRASNRHTLAVRSLYSASPLLVWIFDTPSFILLTLLWASKFVIFQDFRSGKSGEVPEDE